MPSKSVRQPAERERAIKALALRREGLPYREIAERLGWTNEHPPALRLPRLLIRVEYDEVAELRAVKGERLDDGALGNSLVCWCATSRTRGWAWG